MPLLKDQRVEGEGLIAIIIKRGKGGVRRVNCHYHYKARKGGGRRVNCHYHYIGRKGGGKRVNCHYH